MVDETKVGNLASGRAQVVLRGDHQLLPESRLLMGRFNAKQADVPPIALRLDVHTANEQLAFVNQQELAFYKARTHLGEVDPISFYKRTLGLKSKIDQSDQCLGVVVFRDTHG